MAAHIPEKPAPTTLTLSRLRFSTGPSFRVKAVVPLVVFPPEPVEWAISSALLRGLQMSWLGLVSSHCESDGNACAIAFGPQQYSSRTNSKRGAKHLV